MAISFPILKQVNDSFIMGDFNFHSTWPEQKCIDSDFDDIYLTFNQGQESFTMPPSGNFPAWRPDKILSRKCS